MFYQATSFNQDLLDWNVSRGKQHDTIRNELGPGISVPVGILIPGILVPQWIVSPS